MTIKFIADENFNGGITRGLLRREPNLDLIRIQDAGLAGILDAPLLEWTAQNNRVLLTHDVTTITAEAYKRLEAGKFMAGVIEVRLSSGIGRAIDDILTIAGAMTAEELEGQIFYVPL